MLRRPPVPNTPWHRAAAATKWAVGELVHRAWEEVQELGAIGPGTRRGKRFGAFGDGSVICFPATALVNERYIHVGRGTIIGTVLGVLIFATLSNLFIQNNLSISAQSLAKGAIIVVAVLLQQRFAARSRSS